MSDGYTFVSLADLEALTAEHHGDSRLIPVRHALGLRAFGANAWTAETGKNVIPPHEEDSGDEELYVVVAGRVRFIVDGQSVDAPTGTLVHVLPGEHRTALAEEEGTIVLAVGATPGKPFERRGWDDLVVAFAAGRAGRVDEGRAIVKALPEDDQPWVKPYNLACYEARFGDHDRARAYLDEACALSEEARAYAERDTDLESIRT